MDIDRECDPRPTIEELLAESEQASNTFDAVAAQILAGVEALRREGVDLSRLGSLMLLLKWLDDRGRGIDDPLLPLLRAASRSPDPSRLWEFRATCVVAVRVLRALGETAAVAAGRIGRDVGLPGDPATTLRTWRDQLRVGGHAPRDGEHWVILREGRVEIVRLKRDAPHLLPRFYDGVIRHARALTDRGGLTGGLNAQRPMAGSLS